MAAAPSPAVEEAMDRVELRSLMPPGMRSREEGIARWGDGPYPPFPEERRLVLAVAFKKLFAETAPVTAELSVLSNFLIVPNGTMFTMDEHIKFFSANGPGMAKAIAHDLKVEGVLYDPSLPSLPVLKALGLHSRCPNLVLARFHALRLTSKTLDMDLDAWVDVWTGNGTVGGWKASWERLIVDTPGEERSMWREYLS